MKNFKLPAFVLALGLAIMSSFAFNTHKTLTTYHYNGTTQNIADLKDGAQWSVGLVCGSFGNEVCSMNFDGDKDDFDAYISTFTSSFAVLTRADGRKN